MLPVVVELLDGLDLDPDDPRRAAGVLALRLAQAFDADPGPNVALARELRLMLGVIGGDAPGEGDADEIERLRHSVQAQLARRPAAVTAGRGGGRRRG